MKNQLLAISKNLFYFLAELKFSEKDIDIYNAQKKLIVILDEIKLSFQSIDLEHQEKDDLHYILCTVSDEVLFSSMTGYSSNIKSLANQYYHNTSGGEKFYYYLKNWMLNKEKNIHLIEMCYMCLALGFQGKYAVLNDGDVEIKKKINEIDLLLNPNGDLREKETSYQTLMKKKKKKHKRKLFMLILSLLMIAGIYSTYSEILNNEIGELNMTVSSVINGGIINEN